MAVPAQALVALRPSGVEDDSGPSEQASSGRTTVAHERCVRGHRERRTILCFTAAELASSSRIAARVAWLPASSRTVARIAYCRRWCFDAQHLVGAVPA